MYVSPYLTTLPWLATNNSAAKVNARLHVDLNGQPLDGEGRREASEGAANVPSVSGTVAQEPSSSAECKCGCHDPPVPVATVQVKEEQHVVRSAWSEATTLAGSA